MKPGQATKALDKLGIERYCERIVGGETHTSIAAQLGVSRGSLVAWLAADPERSSRAREANMISAAAFDEMAEKAIMGATDVLSLAKARELAIHFRWRASKRDVLGFGDKIGVGGASGLPPIQIDPLPALELARRAAFLFAKAAREQGEMPAEPLKLVAPAPLTFDKTHGYWTDKPVEGPAASPPTAPSEPKAEDAEDNTWWSTDAELPPREAPRTPIRILHRRPDR